jgi:hypothetical protein
MYCHQADAEDRGEDLERRKNWEYTIEENEAWEKRLEQKAHRADFQFNGMRHTRMLCVFVFVCALCEPQTGIEDRSMRLLAALTRKLFLSCFVFAMGILKHRLVQMLMLMYNDFRRPRRRCTAAVRKGSGPHQARSGRL